MAKPLDHVRILDLSRMVAGGLTGVLLADFGADVVKVEQPNVGGPLRKWTSGGVSFWWKVYARNKRFVTLDIQSTEGKEILLRWLPNFDVLIESFVPGTMERFGLGWDTLHAQNPKLVMLRISGWGRSGPGANRPGFGTLVEAATGFAAMNGEAVGSLILPSFPLADMTAGLQAVNAVMFALYHRDVHGGKGQMIDVSLFESLFSLLGPVAAEYAALGKIRTRQGNRSTNSGPRGCYRTSDGHWIAVSGSTPKMAERFLESYGLGELLQDPRFASNEARVRYSAELDSAIGNAIANLTLAENLEIIHTHMLTAHPIQTIADIEKDPHWLERELTIEVDGTRMQNVTPRLSETPGDIRRSGGTLGAHNEEIYLDELKMTRSDLERLRTLRVI